MVEDVETILIVTVHGDLVLRDTFLALTVSNIRAGVVVESVGTFPVIVTGCLISNDNDDCDNDNEGEDDNTDDTHNDVHDHEVWLRWSPHRIKQSLSERSVAVGRGGSYQLWAWHVG